MRTRKSAEIRKSEILDLAASLFAAQGYDRVQIDDVMNASGMSRGGFYHHFKSKTDLLGSLTERETTALAAIARRDPQGLFAGLIRSSRGRSSAETDVFQTLSRPEDIADYLSQLERAQSRHLREPLTEFIAEGIAIKRYAPVNPAHVADLFIAINAHINRRTLSGDWSADQSAGFARTALGAMGALLKAEDEFSALADLIETAPERNEK